MLVDSKHKHLTISEIIKTSLQETNSKYNFNSGFSLIMKELSLPNCKAIQIGNTLFMLSTSQNESTHVFFRALNADTAKNYIENSRKFFKIMHKKGVKVLVSQFNSSSILHIFNIIGKEIQKTNPEMGMKITKTKNGFYQAAINLGVK